MGRGVQRLSLPALLLLFLCVFSVPLLACVAVAAMGFIALFLRAGHSVTVSHGLGVCVAVLAVGGLFLCSYVIKLLSR